MNTEENKYESYTFMGHRFDITKALELIEQGKIKFELTELDSESVKQWATYLLGADKYNCIDGKYQRNDKCVSMFRFEPDKAMQLPDEATKKPVLMIRYNKEDHMLIDGHHRLFKAYMDKTELPVIIVSDIKAIKKFYEHDPRLKNMFRPKKTQVQER